MKGLEVGIKKRVNANCATSFIPIKFHFVIIFDKLSPYLDNESILLKTIWTVSKDYSDGLILTRTKPRQSIV